MISHDREYLHVMVEIAGIGQVLSVGSKVCIPGYIDGRMILTVKIVVVGRRASDIRGRRSRARGLYSRDARDILCNGRGRGRRLRLDNSNRYLGRRCRCWGRRCRGGR